jgi:hypothetical protein
MHTIVERSVRGAVRVFFACESYSAAFKLTNVFVVTPSIRLAFRGRKALSDNQPKLI